MFCLEGLSTIEKLGCRQREITVLVNEPGRVGINQQFIEQHGVKEAFQKSTRTTGELISPVKMSDLKQWDLKAHYRLCHCHFKFFKVTPARVWKTETVGPLVSQCRILEASFWDDPSL